MTLDGVRTQVKGTSYQLVALTTGYETEDFELSNRESGILDWPDLDRFESDRLGFDCNPLYRFLALGLFDRSGDDQHSRNRADHRTKRRYKEHAHCTHVKEPGARSRPRPS